MKKAMIICEEAFVQITSRVVHLEDWGTLEQWRHWNPQSLRVPVSGGAKVDVHAVGEALGSAVDVLNAPQVSVSSLSPKVEKCSWRTHLIQLESERGWSSATLPMSGRTITPNHE
ncbi:unnamed protein product [Sphagnum jensenii]|uniref:Uncharacterized protein n=1 Tax=Sphagnum jensenii TaxID=128206 RepID=A0ABP0VKU8_9BRYO